MATRVLSRIERRCFFLLSHFRHSPSYQEISYPSFSHCGKCANVGIAKLPESSKVIDMDTHLPQKPNAYVHRSGQDTARRLFVVSVVLLAQERDALCPPGTGTPRQGVRKEGRP